MINCNICEEPVVSTRPSGKKVPHQLTRPDRSTDVMCGKCVVLAVSMGHKYLPWDEGFIERVDDKTPPVEIDATKYKRRGV